jgi:phosphoadenosine phosphosulfate reductase
MDLNSKIGQSKKIITRAYKMFDYHEIAVAWTGHKDSTVLLHLAKQICNSPIKAFINITGDDFPEALNFVDDIALKWGVEVVKIVNPDKIAAIESGVKDYGIKMYISAIRRDENSARANEKYFSERPTHSRVHPLLNFTESDIWEYIHKYNIPYLKLYDQGFKSLGENKNTKKTNKDERSGRLAFKELQMERLRSIGYW